jgi:hypothetical protein
MTSLVDEPVWPAHGRHWAHLVSDDSLAELHEFAASLGIPTRGFDRDHYDIPSEYVEKALALGATRVGGKELLIRLVAAGLRVRRARSLELEVG